jgi:hypothetical protein
MDGRAKRFGFGFFGEERRRSKEGRKRMDAND